MLGVVLGLTLGLRLGFRVRVRVRVRLSSTSPASGSHWALEPRFTHSVDPVEAVMGYLGKKKKNLGTGTTGRVSGGFGYPLLMKVKSK